MAYDSPSDHARHFEQLMTTVITCRSVFKYNLTLNNEQKHDLLQDLDQALDLLRLHMLTGSSTPATVEPPVEVIAKTEITPQAAIITYQNEKNDPQTLLALYQMYHSFLDINQHTNMNAFVDRFNDAMVTLRDVQQVIVNNYTSSDLYRGAAPLEEALQSIRVFITDLYYIFMEFMRALSTTLQRNNVYLDTEKLQTIASEHADGKKTERNTMGLLLGAYGEHQRLNEKRGLTTRRLGDATTFLEFLKESMSDDTSLNRREEILSQLTGITRLLKDVAHLLANYEKAAAVFFF